MGAIDGIVPYVVAGGNHDLIEYPADPCSAVTSSIYRGPATLTATFPLARSGGLADGSGSYDGESDNSYLLLSAGGMDLVILNLILGPSDDVLAWAGQIAETYRDRTVIVVTHDYPSSSVGGHTTW